MLSTQNCPVGWGCRIHQLQLCWGVRLPFQWVSWYDTKQSDGEVPVLLGLWGMRSTPSLPSVVAADKGPIYGLNRTNGILLLSWIVWLNWIAYAYAKLNYLKCPCWCNVLAFGCPVCWGCRIYRLHLCRGVRPPLQWVSCYDTKHFDGKVPVMLELWGIRSTPSLPLLPGTLWPGLVASDKGPIYGLNRTNGILMLNWIVWLNWIAWNRNVFDN